MSATSGSSVQHDDDVFVFPASFAQQRLWFLDQLMPGDAVYNVPAVLRVSGSLNMAILEQSLNAIARRHEIMRTTFQVEDGLPVQVISPPDLVPLRVIDLRDTVEPDRDLAALRLAREEVRRPFDLARGPLWRALVLRVGPAEHVLALTMHHIVVDGRSVEIFFQELSSLYEAFSQGKPSPLADLPIQYADFAVWQREWLQGEVFAKQLAYWTRQLEGAPDVLQLPTDHPRPPAFSSRGATRYVVVDQGLSEALAKLSRREGVTLFMTLLAAFQALLFRYTGQQDLLVGTPIMGRTRPETVDLIGFFVNTLVLRTDLSGNTRFRELLHRVREVAVAAFEHQDLPFEQLVQVLRPQRDRSTTPLVQVMLVLQNPPAHGWRLGDLTVHPIEMDTDTAKFDLTLSLEESAHGLKGWIEYNADLFDIGTIERMIGHWQLLLESIVSDPDQPIGELGLVTPVERHQILIDWNATQSSFPRELAVQQLFEVQAARTPDVVAITWGETHLTYGELNARANQLAHHLRGLGVGPEVLVGLCVERSLDLVVGMLGILKAGGAYVPLDPTYPRERLAFMLRDAAVGVLLTQHRLLDALPAEAAQVVCLDTEWPDISRQSAANPVGGAMAEQLAYVMYTSGSSGKPKGVCIPHRAIIRLVRNTNYIQLDASDVIAQASNASFDAATFEVWGALLHGARLIGITKDVALSPREFAAQIRDQKISVLFLTTALFNQLSRDAPWAFHSLRTLLFGGEAVDPRCVAAVLASSPPERLLHVYGPTETTTFASWYQVERVTPGATTIPIGRPIANTELYILDQARHPVPVGMPGELYIGGAGVGRGYLDRPELTAERFIVNPFGDDAAARLFRTGDLVRYRPDGAIEFIGRSDDQVKLRG
ncbi:MAG TPA: amino acid adenylation domain-containing protein, partial [Ktedonobacterales bacterium]|nr:amino acid adenylation domain-containing protein [Ktedonobacterales bacterium]